MDFTQGSRAPGPGMALAWLNHEDEKVPSEVVVTWKVSPTEQVTVNGQGLFLAMLVASASAVFQCKVLHISLRTL